MLAGAEELEALTRAVAALVEATQEVATQIIGSVTQSKSEFSRLFFVLNFNAQYSHIFILNWITRGFGVLGGHVPSTQRTAGRHHA